MIPVVPEVLGEAGAFPEPLAIESVTIGVVAGGVGSQSEHQGHSRRTALGRLAVGPPEGGPPGGQPVDTGGLSGLLAIAAQQRPQIVRGDEQDIGAVLGQGGRGRGRQQRAGRLPAARGRSVVGKLLSRNSWSQPRLRPMPWRTGQGRGPHRRRVRPVAQGRDYCFRGFHQPSSSRSISCWRLLSWGLPARLFNSLGSAVKSNSIFSLSDPSGRINL